MLIMGQGIAEDIADDGVFDQGHSIEIFLDDDMEMSVRVNIAGDDNDDSFFDFLESPEADNPKNWDKYIVSVESTVEDEDPEMYDVVCDHLDKIIGKRKRRINSKGFPGWDPTTMTYTTAFVTGKLSREFYRLKSYLYDHHISYWDGINLIIEGPVTKIDDWVFNDLNIKSLKFEQNKPYIFAHSFMDCEFSFDTLILPEGTKSIYQSFVDTNLKALYLPKSIEYIDFSWVHDFGDIMIYCAGDKDNIHVVESRQTTDGDMYYVSQETLDSHIKFNTTPSDMIANESINKGYSKYSLVKESGVYRFKPNK